MSLVSVSLSQSFRPVRRNADTFGYDARSQLTSATQRSTATNVYTYAYDSAGNRSSAAEAGVPTSYTANELNQYSAISEVLPAYDADGDLLTNGVWSYEWDAENRLSAVYQNGSCVVSNAYDAFSRRVLKVTPAETHTFLSDGWNVVREVVRSSATGAVTETLDYYWGRDLSGSLQGAGGVGGLLAYTRNGALRIPVYDHIGNVVAVVDDTGAIVAAYEYSPFGAIVAKSGPEADEVPFRFSTKYDDSETGLYYYGYRFYAPRMGRWINRDPIGEPGGDNLYCFLYNSVYNTYDILGRSCTVRVPPTPDSGAEWKLSTHFDLTTFSSITPSGAYQVVINGIDVKWSLAGHIECCCRYGWGWFSFSRNTSRKTHRVVENRVSFEDEGGIITMTPTHSLPTGLPTLSSAWSVAGETIGASLQSILESIFQLPEHHLKDICNKVESTKPVSTAIGDWELTSCD